jgi:hypothetical protein
MLYFQNHQFKVKNKVKYQYIKWILLKIFKIEEEIVIYVKIIIKINFTKLKKLLKMVYKLIK